MAHAVLLHDQKDTNASSVIPFYTERKDKEIRYSVYAVYTPTCTSLQAKLYEQKIREQNS